jgi:group I intron endonuclease
MGHKQFTSPLRNIGIIYLIPDEFYSRSGIYAIENIVNGKIYIGSAIHFGHRYTKHNGHLKRGDNKCGLLQKASDKYGIQSLKMYVLEVCEINKLQEREQYWVDTLKPKYNLRIKNIRTNAGMVFSDEWKKNIGLAGIGRVAWNKGMKRPPQSEEAKEKRSRTIASKPRRTFKHTEESKRKTSEKLKGIPTPRKTHTTNHTLEHREKLKILFLNMMPLNIGSILTEKII